MAAGLGTRLKPFTEIEPKALLPLMGTPMAQFALDALAAGGVTETVANVHHHAAKASEALMRLERPASMQLHLSDESEELLGSGGGIRKALPRFNGEPFFLMNADTLCEINLKDLAHAHARLRLRHGVRVTLAVFPRGPRGGKYREILFDPGSELVTGLGEPAEGRPYFVGVAVLEEDALQHAPLGGAFEFVPKILEPAIRAGKCGVFLADGRWYDVGNPALWLDAHCGLMSALETGHLPALWRERIEKRCERLATNLWRSRSGARKSPTLEWGDGAFWDSLGDPTIQPPIHLGPRAVVYGSFPAGHSRLENGIGYRGIWVRA